MRRGCRSTTIRCTLAIALASLATGAARAADGVLELDPACAAVGCFPGDAAGYPIEITLPGSYKLTGNLDVRGTQSPTTTEAIQIFAPAVTLDLAGFLVVGPVVCSGAPLSCAPEAPSGGIHLYDDADGVVVRNGVVSGFGYGVYTNGPTDFARFENLIVYSNRFDGIFGGGAGGQVIGASSFRNGGHGIAVAQASSVRRSTIARNNLHGLVAGTDCLVADNTIYDNGAFGIHGQGRSLYARNVISENNADGLRDDGGGALAYGNTLSNNLLFGIFFAGNTSGYTENVLQGNAAAVLGGISLQQNACNGGNC